MKTLPAAAVNPLPRAQPRIFVAARSPHYRETLRRVIEFAGARLAGQAGTLAGAVKTASRLQPDVILLDIDLVMQVDAERLRRLAEAFSRVRIVVMLNEDTAQYRRAVSERWGYECIAKERPDQELIPLLALLQAP
jgi:DNA-binding NarL/FixJ family response regulator